MNTGGGGGIRTPETLSSLTVFKTAAFNHSATPPFLILTYSLGQGANLLHPEFRPLHFGGACRSIRERRCSHEFASDLQNFVAFSRGFIPGALQYLASFVWAGTDSSLTKKFFRTQRGNLFCNC